MAIFPNLQLEDVVQVNDKTRLNATKSFISKGEAAITLVEIEAEAGSGFVSIGAPGSSKDWYLDWEYATAGTKTVTCRITTSGAPVTKSVTLSVVTAAVDNLFSDDSDLTALESDILGWVPEGRATFKNYHRKAQKQILAWLDENGHTDVNGDRLTAAAIVDKEEVRQWSAAKTISLIFSSISNDPADVFSEKSKKYDSLAKSHRDRLIIRLDTDGDATLEDNEGVNVRSMELIRR